MPDVAYFVHGRGRGHASRAVPIVAALRADGRRVAIYAGQAADLLSGDPGLVARTPIWPGVRGVIDFPGRVAEELRAFTAKRPDLVVSDGDAPGLVAARALDVPAISIGHDLVFSRCHVEGLPAASLRFIRRVAWAASRARHAIAVHFLPIDPSRPRTRVARPVLTRPESTRAPVHDAGLVVAYFRDKNGDAAVDLAARAGFRVLAFGGTPRESPNVRVQPFGDGFVDRLASAAAVITSAGSNVLAECVLYGKPVLALHQAADHEQALNARLVERAGVGVGATFEDLDARTVAGFLDRVRAGDFARVALASALPDTVAAMRDTVADALARR